VRRAIELGLTGLTFTEHYDTHPDDARACVYDDVAYSDTIRRLKDTFGQSIHIGKGIEVDYQPARMPAIVDFLDSTNFDLIMLSVHWCDDMPIYKRRVWEANDPKRLTERYLLAVLDAMNFCTDLHQDRSRVFDVLGHLDFVKRYSLRFAQCNLVDQHAGLIDDILLASLAADVIPEVNTSTIRRGLEDPMPSRHIISRYQSLGGTMMSIGSDSHVATDIGADFDVAIAMLSAAGINTTPVFQNRVRTELPIANET